MNNNKKHFILVFLLLIFLVGNIYKNINLTSDITIIKNNTENSNNDEFSSLKESDYWIGIPFIHIDDNWTDAIAAGYCSGDGSYLTPFLLEKMLFWCIMTIIVLFFFNFLRYFKSINYTFYIS